MTVREHEIQNTIESVSSSKSRGSDVVYHEPEYLKYGDTVDLYIFT